MNLGTQQQYDASPERADIIVMQIFDQPVLENGLPNGRVVRMVEYAPTGSEDMTRIVRPVEEVLNVEFIDDPDSVMHNYAKARAAIFRRALEYHQSMEQTPDGHMALETWAGLTPIMCKALRKAGVRSLQELAEASEPTKARMHVMNPGKLVEHCRMFLASADKTSTTSQLLKATEDNRILSDRIAQMEAKFAAVLAQLPAASVDADESPKRRGRRSNAEIEAQRMADDQLEANA